jgi:hypothetical protein
MKQNKKKEKRRSCEMLKIFVVLCVAAVIFVGAYFLLDWTYNNTNIELRANVQANQKSVENHFDAMWKIIQQVAQVPDHMANQAKEAFKDIYIPLMEGRYGNARGGALMSWISEQNPNYDMQALAKLYENVQVVITSQRTDLASRQDQLIDAQRAHIVFMNKKPNRFFVDQTDTISIKLITSEITNEAVRTGQENNIKLFGDSL